MKHSILAHRGSLLLLAALPCAAQDALSFQGYTGLLNTPNAEVLPEGTLVALHSTQVDARYRGPGAYAKNNMVSLGMLPGLEINLRLTEFPIIPMGDLSGSLKYQVPGLPQWMPRVAFGVQDFSGNGYLKTKYVVMSQAFGSLNLSLGEGTGPERMKGTFGGAEWRLTPWLQLMAERDTTDNNLGLKLQTPPGLLPGGCALGVILKDSLEYQPRHVNAAFTLSIPLGRRPRSGPPDHQLIPAPAPPAPSPSLSLAPTAPLPSLPVRAERKAPNVVPAPASLAMTLMKLGFENVRAGFRGTTLVVEYENNRYNHNDLDGLGLVLGTTLANAPAAFDQVLIAVRKQDIRVLELEGPVQELRAFFNDTEPAGFVPSLTIRQAESFRSIPGVTWTGAIENLGWFHSRLSLGPGLNTSIGNEVGAWNYALSLVPDFQASLWPGAVINYRGSIPLTWTRNYNENGPFGSPGSTSPALQRIWFSQDLPLAHGLMAQVGAGAYSQQAQGVMADLMWTPGTGQNRFTLKAAHFQNTSAWPGPDFRIGLASYRAFIPALDTYLVVTAGQFLNNDHGLRLEVKRFFNDTSMSVYYSHTTVQELGVILTLPLTPRRDMSPGWLQIRGNERWGDGLATTIRTPVNYLAPGLATVPDTTVNLERTFYNNDRLNETYLRANLKRLREAYRFWRPAPPL